VVRRLLEEVRRDRVNNGSILFGVSGRAREAIIATYCLQLPVLTEKIPIPSNTWKMPTQY
jgi:hypothetical protein